METRAQRPSHPQQWREYRDAGGTRNSFASYFTDAPCWFAPRLRMGYIRLFGFRREDDRPATRTITNPVNETQPPEAVLYAIHAH